MNISAIVESDIQLINAEIKQCLICLKATKRYNNQSLERFIEISKSVFDDFVIKFIAPSLNEDDRFTQEDKDNYIKNIEKISDYIQKKHSEKLHKYGLKTTKANKNKSDEAQVAEIRKAIKKSVGKLGVFYQATNTIQLPALIGSLNAVLKMRNLNLDLLSANDQTLSKLPNI